MSVNTAWNDMLRQKMANGGLWPDELIHHPGQYHRRMAAKHALALSSIARIMEHIDWIEDLDLPAPVRGVRRYAVTSWKGTTDDVG